MEGVIELAEEIFHMPVRLGVPQNVAGLVDVVQNPIHATGVGLLNYALLNRSAGKSFSNETESSFNSVWERMKSWFQGHF